MNIKNIKSLLVLMLLPLAISISGCDKKQESESTNKSEDNNTEPVEEPVITSREFRASIKTDYQGEKSSSYLSYKFDLEDFINVTDEPNKNIARMSILFDANISAHAQVGISNAEYAITGYSDEENFYKNLGLDGLEKIDVSSSNSEDVNDVSRLNIAHKAFNGHDICFITIIDSGLGNSWISNFDVGIDDESYYSKTGEHTEWTNKDNHKGFDITGNRIINLINDYKNRVLDKNSQQIFYVFGHSRGGALANIVGAKLVDLNYKVVSYGLASPAVTTSENASLDKYKHLYSYVNDEDAITKLLKPEWGFTRYGVTYHFSIKDYLESFKACNGYDFPSSNNSFDIAAMLASLCDGRDGIYQFADRFTVATSGSLQPSGVGSYINNILSPLSGKYEILKNFVECQQIENTDGTIIVKVRACPGFLITFFGMLISQVTEEVSTSAMMSEFMTLRTYLNCFMNAAGIKLTDLMGFSADYFIVCHSFPSYLTYVHLL